MLKTKVLAQERTIALGLDVDAQTVAVAALDVSNGEILLQGRLSPAAEDWQTFLLHFPGCALWACYEAGYTGFHLLPSVADDGVDCRVVARVRCPRVRRDAAEDRPPRCPDARWQLTSFAAHLRRLPTQQEEQDRQLLRTREQLLRDRTRTQNRIKAFLAFHHCAVVRPDHWSRAEKETLRQALLPEVLRTCLDIQLEMLERLNTQIRALDRELACLSREDRYHDRCALLRTIPGVGHLTAMAFLLEVFRPEEFEIAEALACHVEPHLLRVVERQPPAARTYHPLGLAPLRRLLVEAAWSWVRKDEQAQQQFDAISQHGKCKKIAIVGMARRLAVACWAMTVKGEPFAYRFAA